jgi:hypothetical protein
MPQAEEPGSRRARSGGFGRLVTALAAGIAGGLIAPLIYPAVARGARPAAKRAMKASIAAFERGRVAAAELSEHASDLFAEARAEYDDEHQPGARRPQDVAASEVVALRGSSREAAGS